MFAAAGKVQNIRDLAAFITSPECKSVAFLTGAGVSVSAGIPDFRSPGGMYDTLPARAAHRFGERAGGDGCRPHRGGQLESLSQEPSALPGAAQAFHPRRAGHGGQWWR